MLKLKELLIKNKVTSALGVISFVLSVLGTPECNDVLTLAKQLAGALVALAGLLMAKDPA